MPGYKQTQANYQARNANTVLLLIGDQPVGFAQTVTHSFDGGAQQLYGVGSAMPQEVQQLRWSPTITVDRFALSDEGLALLGQSITGPSLPLSSILSNTVFNLHIIDGVTGSPLFTYVGCMASNFSQNIAANSVVTEAITFLSLDVYDATGQSILNVGNALTIPQNVPTASVGLGVAVTNTP